MKTVICYAYYETPSSKYNLSFFVKNELHEREDIDYILVINGETCTVPLPNMNNLIVIRRENTGFDFGAHSVALKHIKDSVKEYNYFIFLNGSVIGPIVPHYLRTDVHWSRFLLTKSMRK